jgi:hypothetical protein
MGANQNSSEEFGLYPKINPNPQHTTGHRLYCTRRRFEQWNRRTRDDAMLRPLCLNEYLPGRDSQSEKETGTESKDPTETGGENQLKTGGACYEEKSRTKPDHKNQRHGFPSGADRRANSGASASGPNPRATGGCADPQHSARRTRGTNADDCTQRLRKEEILDSRHDLRDRT